MNAINARTCLLATCVFMAAGCFQVPAMSQDKNGASGKAAKTVSASFEQQFARLDADGGGKVTWSEAYAVRVREFAEMDANRDGIVDRSEYGARRVPMTQFDPNADGRLELSEYVGQHRKRFRMADADRDGSLSLHEYARAQQAMRSQ